MCGLFPISTPGSCRMRRERNDGLYRPITYLVAKMTEELTIFFFLSLVLTAIVFAPCKLGGSYILFWLVNFVTTATGIGARAPVPATMDAFFAAHAYACWEGDRLCWNNFFHC